jgi:hypothetical protein
MLNNIRLFANGESRLDHASASRRRARRSCRYLVVGLSLLCSTLLAPRASATSDYTIYMYNSQGVLQNETAYYSYQGGHIFDLATGLEVGTVNPSTDTIYDANENVIGVVETAD